MIGFRRALMGPFGRLLLILAAVASAVPVSVAEDGGASTLLSPAGAIVSTPGISAAASMEGSVSLDLRNIDIVEALKFVAIKAGINIIATKNVSGRVTLMVDNVPVRDIFDIMLRSNGLAYTKQSNIYNVMTEEEYKAIFGKKFSDVREVRVFRLKYAIPDQAFTMLDALKSEVGRVLVEPDSGTALVMDTPEKIAIIREALESLEQKNIVKVFTLKYAKAKEVEEQLKTQLDAKKVGSVKADERSNQVIIQTLPDRMKGIEKLIESLDRKTKQVLISTKIIKIKLSDQLAEGIQWEGLASLGKELGLTYLGSTPFSVLQASTAAWQSRNAFANTIAPAAGIGAYPFSGNSSSSNSSTKVNPGQNVHFGIINKVADIDAVVNYMQTLGKTQVISNPTLGVINNQEARIHVGERQAYVTTTTTTGQTTTTVSEEVTFVDVGIQLAVTPTINDDGFVTMKIKPEISSVVTTLTTPSGNKIPIIDTSMAETTVMVRDGMTIIIGGLRKEEKTSDSAQVPYAANIPILGKLFKNSSGKTERTELMILITPKIVTGEKLEVMNERAVDKDSGRGYDQYRKMTDDTEYEAPQPFSDETIKPYREYVQLAEKEEAYTPAIKGEKE